MATTGWWTQRQHHSSVFVADVIDGLLRRAGRRRVRTYAWSD
jgi:hypothetical protein